MTDIVINRNGVHKQLKSLRGCGAGWHQPKSIKRRELTTVLAAPLTTLFQASLDKAIVLSKYKKLSVSPIYKEKNLLQPTID